MMHPVLFLLLVSLMQINPVWCQVEMGKPVNTLPSTMGISSDSAARMKNALHILVANKDFATAYWNGADSVKSYFLQPQMDWGSFLRKCKVTYGDSLTVIVKLSPQVAYSQTIDLLDELTINKIGKFAFAEITEDDVQRFLFHIKPPERVEITSPSVVSHEVKLTRQNALIIQIDSKGKADLQYFDEKEKLTLHKVQSHKEDIQAFIAKAAQLAGGVKELHVMLVGAANAKLPVFNNIIQALRQNEIYSYKLITTLEEDGYQKD
jgi:biopolymer transport protein ExbD